MRKIDMTGQKYGMLTVLHEADRSGYWVCQCDCGNVKEIYGQNIRNGKSHSCGCAVGKGISKDDITGQRFGLLTVLHKTERNGYWLCQCDCGNTVEASIYKLKSNHTKSCGCLKLNDLTGQRFGRLTVLRRSERKTECRQYYWICQCDCGSVKEVIHSSLTGGTCLSCGCLHSDSVNDRMQRIAALKTNPDTIRYCTKPRKDSKTGITGVTYNKKRGLYIARISFKGVRYTLKESSDIEQCIAARKEAEEALFGNVLEWYDATYGTESRMTDERKSFLEEKKAAREKQS